MIYLFNNIAIFLYYFMLKHIKISNRNMKFLLLCFMQMSIIIGFRYAVGADFFSYVKIYDHLKNNESVHIEIAYKIINIICIKLEIPYWGVNLFLAILTNLFLIFAIKEFEINPVSAVFFYISFFFFYHSMNQVRQGVAMTIGLYAISKLCKGENIKFFFFVIFASLFHMSALIYLILYFLKEYKIDLKLCCIYLFGSLIVLGGYNVFTFVISFSKYGLYFNSYYDKQFTITSIANLCVRLMLLTVVMHYSSKVKNGIKKNVLYHMTFLCTFFQVITVYSSIFGRVTSLFFIGYIILFPLVIASSKKQVKRLCYLGAGLYQFVYYQMMKTSVLINNYQSIFNYRE